MSKRKYKIAVDIVLIFLCLFPLVALLFTMYSSTTILNEEQILNVAQSFTISQEFTDSVHTALSRCTINLDGVFGGVACVLLSNAVLIHILYVFLEVLCFVPKFAIKLLNISVGEK